MRAGGSKFKAIRGEYGGGKTFFARWVQERAKRLGFATSEVQISETETPLHRLETVYRRLMERLSTASVESGALRSIVDGWFFTLEEDVLADGLDPRTPSGFWRKPNGSCSRDSRALPTCRLRSPPLSVDIGERQPLETTPRRTRCSPGLPAAQRRRQIDSRRGPSRRHRSFRRTQGAARAAHHAPRRWPCRLGPRAR